MKTFERIFVATNRWLLIAILSGMAILVFLNVCLRFFTNHSITWSDEVARHLMIWLTFIGAGITLRHGSLTVIDNVQLMMSARNARILRALSALIMLAFFLVMIWVGRTYVERTMLQTTPSTRIPFGYIYLAMPIGFTLLILHLLLVVRAYLAGGMSALQGDDDLPPMAN
ncbi:MAG: TRAP transporter small permease [Pseudorhizobium sp.]|jgi:TRAP-type C4-dicarboxylate transport system permease small subunit